MKIIMSVFTKFGKRKNSYKGTVRFSNCRVFRIITITKVPLALLEKLRALPLTCLVGSVKSWVSSLVSIINPNNLEQYSDSRSYRLYYCWK